jgi:hypothetical protein
VQSERSQHGKAQGLQCAVIRTRKQCGRSHSITPKQNP